MVLRIYDSLKKEKVQFEPLEQGKVKMYSCGPTVYNHIHIGNAKTFLAFDFIKRCLIYVGYDVNHVQNITDVGHLTDDADEGEDKISKQAKAEKIDPYKIAKFYEKSYLDDMKDLGALEASHNPRATEYIQEIINFTQTLIEKGFGYVKNGSVYFRVTKFEEYGKLSGNRLEDLKQDASERTIKSDEKEDPRDFALWKAADKNHLMQWDSPWGRGFPGWHIECSVMAKELLGDTIDIKGGGWDLKFPHHEDEIAQSESCTGKTYANYYMHSAFMLVNGERMGKSKGNFFTARELIEKWGAKAVRLALITNQYRQQINFSDDLLLQSQKSLQKIQDTFQKLKSAEEFHENKNELEIIDAIEEHENNIIEAINDDFNAPRVMSEIYAFVKLVNQTIDANQLTQNLQDKMLEYFSRLDTLLNVLEEEKQELDDNINYLLELRKKARDEKDWTKSDELRDEIAKLGYTVKDSKQGQIISKN